jgi:hypothetical protein
MLPSATVQVPSIPVADEVVVEPSAVVVVERSSRLRGSAGSSSMKLM